MSRIAESGSNRSALYEPDVNGALIGASRKARLSESTFRAAAYVRESGVISPLEISFLACLVFDLTSDQDLGLKFRRTRGEGSKARRERFPHVFDVLYARVKKKTYR